MTKRIETLLILLVLSLMTAWVLNGCDDPARFLGKRPDALRVPWVWVETTRVEAGGEGRVKP